MKTKTFLFVVLVFCCLLFWGQEKKEQPKVRVEKQVQQEPQEELPPAFESPTQVPGEYVYKAEGRRDPFLNLLNLNKGRESRQSIEGVGGLMIDELELEGIIKAYGTFRAMLRGPDSKPYVVTVGDKVYDGEVVSIDINSISFKKISTIMISGQKEKIITKTLNPEKEED